MNILVTGGAGFIGHHLVQILQEQGFNVFAMDNVTTYLGTLDKERLEALFKERTRNFNSDVLRTSIDYPTNCKQAMSLFDIDIVIHLAAFPRAKIVNTNPVAGAATMIKGMTNLLDASVLGKVKRFVYASSSMIYGDFNGGVQEDAEAKPSSLYATYKLAGEQLTKFYANKHKFDYTIVRPSAVYGPRDVEDRVVGKFLTNAINDLPLNVNGINERLDFTYVNDLANGIALAATDPGGINETFNLTRGEDRTIIDAAELACKLVGKGDIKVCDKNPLMPSRGYLDISKARELLNYNPTVNIEEGFKKYYEWLK